MKSSYPSTVNSEFSLSLYCISIPTELDCIISSVYMGRGEGSNPDSTQPRFRPTHNGLIEQNLMCLHHYSANLSPRPMVT